jgi:hypothetical protein
MAIETMAFGYWIFQLNAQITELKQQINTMQANENEEERVNVQKLISISIRLSDVSRRRIFQGSQ